MKSFFLSKFDPVLRVSSTCLLIKIRNLSKFYRKLANRVLKGRRLRSETKTEKDLGFPLNGNISMLKSESDIKKQDSSTWKCLRLTSEPKNKLRIDWIHKIDYTEDFYSSRNKIEVNRVDFLACENFDYEEGAFAPFKLVKNLTLSYGTANLADMDHLNGVESIRLEFLELLGKASFPRLKALSALESCGFEMIEANSIEELTLHHIVSNENVLNFLKKQKKLRSFSFILVSLADFPLNFIPTSLIKLETDEESCFLIS